MNEAKENINLYVNNNDYRCNQYKDRDEWLKNRIDGIGGSDASTLIGMNKYKDNLTLWKEKKGYLKDTFEGNKATEYGSDAEEPLRKLFALKNDGFDVQYLDNVTLQSNQNEWMLYSPDGLLFHEEKGRGILEIKTTLIQDRSMYEQWKEQVPMSYFIQTLHGLLVTGFDYVVFYAELRFAWNRKTELVQQEFTRTEVAESLEWLKEKEESAYQYYIDNVEPPRLINI